MKVFILAAGVGSRLRPITDTIPKALVPVCGTPMLQHVILRLKSLGFDDFVINVHHFANQIIDFLEANNDFGVNVAISHEENALLDTGGAILHAAPLLGNNEPVLIHNVDILSNCDLMTLVDAHNKSGADATMLVSDRVSSRYLLFDNDMRLHGWINKATGALKPEGFDYVHGKYIERPYDGIQVFSPSIINRMRTDGLNGKFSIVDFYLDRADSLNIIGMEMPGMVMLDIGKPDTLVMADEFLKNNC